MSVNSGQPITADFTTRNAATGARANADSTPTGILVIGGVDNGATVTVTNITTGRYKAAFTLPTDLIAKRAIELVVTATVSGVTDSDVVWRDNVSETIRDIGTIVSAGGTSCVVSGLNVENANTLAGCLLIGNVESDPAFRCQFPITGNSDTGGTNAGNCIIYHSASAAGLPAGAAGDTVMIQYDSLLTASEILGAGTGDTDVDHNTPTPDALRYTYGSGAGMVGIDNATVRAYTLADYAAGNRTLPHVEGQAKTGIVAGVSGRWLTPIRLTSNSGSNSYVIEFTGGSDGVRNYQTVTNALSL